MIALPSFRRLMAWVLLPLLVPACAAALEVAAQGRTPEHAIAVISITDTRTLWHNAATSKLGAATKTFLTRMLAGSGGNWDAFAKDRPRIEQALGFSLDPDNLFSETIRGADLYLVESAQDGPPVGVLLVRFTDQTTAHRVVDHLLNEARQSVGMLDGQRAADVRERAVDDSTKLYILPGLKLAVTSMGALLVLSSTEEGVMSAVRGKANAPLLNSEAFRSVSNSLDGQPSQMWAYGDMQRLAGLFVKHMGLPKETMSNMAELGGACGCIAEFRADSIKMTQFRPLSELGPAERSLVAAAPPDPRGFDAARFLPAKCLVGSVMNNFDSATVLKAMRNGMSTASAGSPNPMAAIMPSIESVVGAIANDGALAITSMTVQSDKSALPVDGDFLVALRLADRERMRATLLELESKASGSNDAGMSQFKEVDYNGAMLHVLDLSAAAGPGKTLPFSPTYTITADGYLVLALKKDTVTAALDRSGSPDAPFLASADAARASKQLSAARSSFTMVDLHGVAEVVNMILSMVPAGGTHPEAVDAVRSLTVLLSTASSLCAAKTYTADGMTGEALLLM